MSARQVIVIAAAVVVGAAALSAVARFVPGPLFAQKEDESAVERIGESGGVGFIARWWLGDGRRPPMPVREATLGDNARPRDTMHRCLRWWIGDGRGLPRPLAHVTH